MTASITYIRKLLHRDWSTVGLYWCQLLIEAAMATGYYIAQLFHFVGEESERRQKNKGILRLGYHRYPSKYTLSNLLSLNVACNVILLGMNMYIC
jgi:hypothetical protein